MYGSLSVFFHSQNALASVCLSTWPPAQQRDGCLINELSSQHCCKAPKCYHHLSHLHLWLRDKKVRYTEICYLPKVRQQPEKLRHWVCLARGSPAFAPQWSSTGVLVPVTLVKAAPDGCNSSFSAAKFFYGKLLEHFFSWDGQAVLCLLTKPFPSRLCELAHICWASVPTHPCCSAPHN